MASRMKRLLAACVAGVALLFAGASLTAAAQDAPRQPDGTLAVPPLARVTDLAGVLSAADRARLEGQLSAFEAKKGSQIAVLVVPSTKPEPIADFAQRVGDAWKIGRKGVGDGVLLAIAIQDRQIWISVALALEGAIPDVTAARISREVIAPRFREGRFADGIGDGLDRLFRQIEGEKLPEPSASFELDSVDALLATLMPIVIVGVIVGTVLRRLIGGTGALLAGGGAGAVSWLVAASVGGAVLAGLAVLILSFGAGTSGGGRAIGGRRGGGFTPGGWSGGSSSGGWSSGSSSGGGWSSGGGGNFSGGGGGSSW